MEGYHIDDSACAASTLWWPASTFPPSSVEGYHIVDTRMCSPQQRCHRMLFFLQRQIQPAYLLHLAKNFAPCPTSPIASDADDILNHSFFLPRSLHMIFTCDIYIPLLLTPPSCVYRFLWERTVSIIFTHLISPFLFTPFIYLEGLYHGQSEPEVDLHLSTLPVRVYTHVYICIYIFLYVFTFS